MSDVIHAVNEIQIHFENSKEKVFIEETRKDENLNKIIEYCKNGWPKTVDHGGELKHF